VLAPHSAGRAGGTWKLHRVLGRALLATGDNTVVAELRRLHINKSGNSLTTTGGYQHHETGIAHTQATIRESQPVFACTVEQPACRSVCSARRFGLACLTPFAATGRAGEGMVTPDPPPTPLCRLLLPDWRTHACKVAARLGTSRYVSTRPQRSHSPLRRMCRLKAPARRLPLVLIMVCGQVVVLWLLLVALDATGGRAYISGALQLLGMDNVCFRVCQCQDWQSTFRRRPAIIWNEKRVLVCAQFAISLGDWRGGFAHWETSRKERLQSGSTAPQRDSWHLSGTALANLRGHWRLYMGFCLCAL